MLLQGLTYVMLFSYSSASPLLPKGYHMSAPQFSVMLATRCRFNRCKSACRTHS